MNQIDRLEIAADGQLTSGELLTALLKDDGSIYLSTHNDSITLVTRIENLSLYRESGRNILRIHQGGFAVSLDLKQEGLAEFESLLVVA